MEKRRAAADVAVQVVGRALNLLAGVVVTVVVTRTLGDSGFGQWATILAVLQIAGYVGDFGLEQVAVRRAAAEPEREREWLGGLLTLRLVIAVPLTVVTAAVQLAIADSDEMKAAGLILCGTLILSALSVTRAVFQLRVRNHLTIAVLTVNSALWSIAVLAIAAGSGGMVAFAAAFLGAATVSTGLNVLMAVRISPPKLRGSRRVWGDLLRVGAPVAAAAVLTTAYVRIDHVLVFELAGDREAGLYGAIYRILDSAQFVPGAVMTTLFPAVAAAWPADPAKVRRLSQGAGEYLAMVSLPALGFTLVAAEPIVLLLFGEEFRDAAPALPILMGAFVLISLAHVTGHLVLVLGLQQRLLAYAAAGLVLNVGLNLLLIPSYGFLGAAWVTLATELLVTGLVLLSVTRKLGHRPLLGRLARITAGTAGVTAIIALAQLAGVPLGGLIGLALLGYPLALLAVGALSLADIRDLRRSPGSPGAPRL